MSRTGDFDGVICKKKLARGGEKWGIIGEESLKGIRGRNRLQRVFIGREGLEKLLVGTGPWR